jgi:EAL domain-containing protein (putative c-di-GMP-specific phosphodiesterase class I)
VVGEGVETNEVLAGLHASGCDIAQGYLLARPMPAERLHEWIAHQALVTRPAAAT